MTSTRVGIVGAASYVGSAALSSAVARGLDPTAYSRKKRHSSGVRWSILAEQIKGESIPLWIDVGPIWSFHERCDAILRRGAKKIVPTSSTSRFTKPVLGNAQEVETARLLASGEDHFIQWCESHSIQWVILRPTLIYGMGQDKNIREIARLIRRFGMFPLLGGGTGLRQPIHAEDLGEACVSALLSDVSTGKAYNVSGGEVLSYRQMIHRVFAALGMKPRTPNIPLPVFRAALAIMQALPRYRKWSPQMAQRMNNNMIFDHAEAEADFGFRPRPFTLTLSDLA